MKTGECGIQEPRSCKLWLLRAYEIIKQEKLSIAMGGSSGEYSSLTRVLRVSDCHVLVPKEGICMTSQKPQGTKHGKEVGKVSEQKYGQECCEALSFGYEIAVSPLTS